MSKHNPADIGGEPAGAIDTVDHGLKFWEKQANALRNTLTSGRIVRLDELRRAAEDLGLRYYRLDYFQRTTEALRNLLLEKGVFTRAELERKMDEVRKRYDA
jgi:nitrile hydratase beta subunit-like protein